MNPANGIAIGINDRNGNPLHIGDTLHFDAAEWGGDGCTFTIELRDGAIQHPGATKDLSEWCDLVRRWERNDD